MMKPVLIVLAATILTITVGMVLMMVSSEDRQVITAPTPTPIPLEQVAQAAQVDLNYLIRHIQPLAQNYGFADEQEINEITLGLPYELYNLNYDQVLDHTSDMATKQVLIPAQQWIFPVLLDGQAKGVAILGDENGTLRFVGYSGSPQLAQSLVNFQTQHDQVENTSLMKVLQIPPLETNFAITQHGEQTDVTLLSEVAPGTERGVLTDLNTSQTYDLNEIMPQIVQELEEVR